MSKNNDNSEKEKLDYEHKLKMRQIILDKLLWAVVVLLLAFFANWFFEDYKAELAKERLLLEKKYGAITDTLEAESKLMVQFDNFTRKDKYTEVPSNHQQLFLNSLQNFISTFNKYSILLPVECAKSGRYFIAIFSALYSKDVSKCKEYREFVSQVTGWFGNLLLQELNLSPFFRTGRLSTFQRHRAEVIL